MVDTGVFIVFERSGNQIDLTPWSPSEEVFISAVTVSELLLGVHRADNAVRRERRSAFVEAIICGLQVLDFSTAVARTHSQIHADLMQRGQVVGAHDLFIAATALHHNLSVLTENVSEFARIPGLRVIEFSR